MKILSFHGTKINGYLNLHIGFYEDLTFVTGVNGTGKTTALNSIISLLMPKVDYLTLQNYAEISLDLIHDGAFCRLSSRRTPNGARLTVSFIPEAVLELTAMEWDDGISASRNREIEQTFYKEQIARQANNPVLRFIQSLPTPMFLGLDRRVISLDESLHHRYSGSFGWSRPARRKSVFSQSLSQGLSEAQGFAMERHLIAQQTKNRLDYEFRQELVVNLINFKPFTFPELTPPSRAELEALEKTRLNLQRLPGLLGVEEDLVAQNMAPLFHFLEQAAEQAKNSKRRKAPDEFDDDFNALVEWSFNKSQISKLSLISEQISSYNKRVDRAFRSMNAFTQSLRPFFGESGKSIQFNSLGELVFVVSGEKEERDLRDLSSGEVQLIVLLAHLYFNPEVERAGIFIIDEPELSLHVEWQEKFVDTMLSANKKIQFIMATHSPSIILDRVDHCVDLTPRTI